MNKYLFLVAAVLFSGITLQAQLKVSVRCDPFYVDILNGKVNEMKPNAGIEEIKIKFPCFTSTEAETAVASCGGGFSLLIKTFIFIRGGIMLR